MIGAVRNLGRRGIDTLWRGGSMARFFWMVLSASGISFRRFRLTIREIYFAGVMSLVIIMVSGLFVGMVLGLQGFETLQKYGAEETMGSSSHCRWFASWGRWSPPSCSPVARDRPLPLKSV